MQVGLLLGKSPFIYENTNQDMGFFFFFCTPASLQIEYPMLFELNNPAAGRITHCGVLEFIADEGLIYLPYWVCFLSLLSFESSVVLQKFFFLFSAFF